MSVPEQTPAGRDRHPCARALYEVVADMNIESSLHPDIPGARIRGQAVDLDEIRIGFIVGRVDLDHAWAALDAGRLTLANLRGGRVFQQHIDIARRAAADQKNERPE